MNGTSYPFRGRLDASGAATVAVLRRALPPTALGFQVDRSGLASLLPGSVTNAFGTNTLVSELFAAKKILASQNTSVALKQFVLQNVADETTVGTGWVLFASAGGIHIHSRLADGRTADSTSFLFPQDFDGANLPVFLSFNGGREIIIGLAKVDLEQQGILSGELWQAESGSNPFSTRVKLAPY